MFLSALAPNLLALALVKSIIGFEISWGMWFLAFLPLGVLLILTMPLLAYWFYPPEVKVPGDKAHAGQTIGQRDQGGKPGKGIPGRFIADNVVPVQNAGPAAIAGSILLLLFVCSALLMWIFAARSAESHTAAAG